LGDILVSVEPRPNESLAGYLIAVAEANVLLGPQQLLIHALGRGTRLPRTSQLRNMAVYCRQTPSSMSCLFGWEYRRGDGTRRWRLGDEWITRDVFVRTQTKVLCPRCMCEDRVHRGVWDLTLYAACPRHQCQLLERCPACARQIRWNRPRLSACHCGFLFQAASAVPCSRAALDLARIIETRVSDSVSLGHINNVEAAERLAPLGLDAAMKAVWLLGHCLANPKNLGAGHGRLKPNLQNATRLIERAFDILDGWPRTFCQALEQRCASLPTDACKREIEIALGPIHSFVRGLEHDAELAFVTDAYEQWLWAFWRHFSNEGVTKKTRIRQLELDL
jgi:hypothetical protein